MGKTLDEKLREIEKVITCEDFREMKGLAMKLPIIYLIIHPRKN